MKKNIYHIVGGGPAGLMAAQRLLEEGYTVHIWEKNKALARKFLVAGHGGFNLTHSEPIDSFIEKYNSEEVRELVKNFNNESTIEWLQKLGIPTFIGSSGKVFPIKGIKPIQVLNHWIQYLLTMFVHIHYQHELVTFNDKELIFNNKGQSVIINYEKCILALGGMSWPQTGSDGSWKSILSEKGIDIEPLSPSNSGLNIGTLPESLIGQSLKNIAVHYLNTWKYGEIVFTEYGIEGAPVYHLNDVIRKDGFQNPLYIDLKPQFDIPKIVDRLSHSNKNITDLLKKELHLDKASITLLKLLDKSIYMDIEQLAISIKRYPLNIKSFRPIDEVISTYGGIKWHEIDKDLYLKKYPNIAVIGEMVDWDAPTGGYLLQACFAFGYGIKL